MKAWSSHEEDKAYHARLVESTNRLDKELAVNEFEKRRAAGQFLFEQHEQQSGQNHVKEASLSGYETNPLFHNLGGRFVDLSTALGAGLTDDARAVVAMDLDRDGDQDLVVHNQFKPQLVALRNDLGRGRSVDLLLRGTKSNRWGVGARVVAAYGGRRQAQDLVCGGGYLSGLPMELHWGLGDAEKIDRFEIAWPSGEKQVVENVAPGRVTVEEGKGVVEHVPHSKAAPLPVAPPERIAREGDAVRVTGECVDGSAFDSASLKGRPVLLHFWSGFCKACHADVENYAAILAELKRIDPSFELVSLSIDGDMERLKKQHGETPFAVKPVLLRDHARGFAPSNDPVVPLAVVVGPDGVARARRVGASTPAQLAAFAKAALGK